MISADETEMRPIGKPRPQRRIEESKRTAIFYTLEAKPLRTGLSDRSLSQGQLVPTAHDFPRLALRISPTFQSVGRAAQLPVAGSYRAIRTEPVLIPSVLNLSPAVYAPL